MIQIKQFVIFSTLFVVALTHGKKSHKCMQESMALAKCCQLPADMTITRFLDSSECRSPEPTGDSGKEMFRAQVCHAECVYRTRGITNENGEIDKVKLHQMADVFLQDHQEFKAPTFAAIDKCMQHSEIGKHRKSETSGEKRCGMSGFKMNMCTFESVVRNCPESKQIDSDECKALKSKAMSLDDCLRKN